MDVTELLTKFQPVFESLKYSGEPDKDGRKIVKYEAKRDVLTNLDSSVGGLYVVYESKDGEIPHPLYAGKFSGTFTKRWLYSRDEYLYHFKHESIADSLMEGNDITVKAISKDNLYKTLDVPDHLKEWVSLSSIEERLIRYIKELDSQRCWNQRD